MTQQDNQRAALEALLPDEFKSGNSVQVERVTLTRSRMIDVLQAAIAHASTSVRAQLAKSEINAHDLPGLYKNVYDRGWGDGYDARNYSVSHEPDDPTGDGGTMIVRAVMQAVRPVAEPAKIGPYQDIPEAGYEYRKAAEPKECNKATQDQIASVMLQHGTPKQQAEALRYCGIEPVKCEPKDYRSESEDYTLGWNNCLANMCMAEKTKALALMYGGAEPAHKESAAVTFVREIDLGAYRPKEIEARAREIVKSLPPFSAEHPSTPNWTARHNSVAKFALQRFINTCYDRANAAAQLGSIAAARFLDDAKVAEECRAMLESPNKELANQTDDGDKA